MITAAIIKNIHLNYGKLEEKRQSFVYDAIATAILPFATIPHIIKWMQTSIKFFQHQVLQFNVNMNKYIDFIRYLLRYLKAHSRSCYQSYLQHNAR